MVNLEVYFLPYFHILEIQQISLVNFVYVVLPAYPLKFEALLDHLTPSFIYPEHASPSQTQGMLPRWRRVTE